MNQKSYRVQGHLAVIFACVVWGTTFVSSKYLLQEFAPTEILFFRYLLGLGALFLFYPKRLKGTTWKQEVAFALAGLCGITLYTLMENTALTLTQASNVGVVVSSAPLFTAILVSIFLKEEKISFYFFIGFISAMLGIALISFHGSSHLELNPIGDLLAVGAAIAWGFYNILLRKIHQFGYHPIQVNRRIFMYGLFFVLPVLHPLDFNLGLYRFANPFNVLNLVFLGLIASALCFVLYNVAVNRIGALKTSAYIYGIPVITIIMAVLFLDERMTVITGIGSALTLLGLVISEKKRKKVECT